MDDKIQKYFNGFSNSAKYIYAKEIKEIGAEAWYIKMHTHTKKDYGELMAGIVGTIWILSAIYYYSGNGCY